MNLFIFLIAIVLCCVAGYVWIRHKYAYWANQNVAFARPSFPYGNIGELGKRYHISQLMRKFYDELKGRGPLGGFYAFIFPQAIATDLDLIKDIFTKDFNYFEERGFYYNERDDPISAHLLTIGVKKWRILRQKLTPTFTSGKLKLMFSLVVDVADLFRARLIELAAKDSALEMGDLCARFTTDVIGLTIFGINCNSLTNPKAEFRVMGKKVFTTYRNSAIKAFFMNTFPDVARALRMKCVQDDVSEFFMTMISETIEYREKNNIQGHDFMHMMVRLKNTGKLDDESTEIIGRLTVEEIAAQAYIFFLAGYDTSSMTLSCALFELAKNIPMQNRARKEVNDVLAKHGDQMSYDCIQEMPYIDMIINGMCVCVCDKLTARV